MVSSSQSITALTTIDEPASDAALIARASSDRAEFASIYQRFAHDVYRYCYRCLGSKEDAEDATSQVFTKAMANFERLDHDNLRPWIFRIAHNVVIDMHRAHRPATSLHEVPPQPAHAQSPESAAIEHDLQAQVTTAIASLSERDQQLVNLRLAGLTGAELAEAMDMNHGAVRMAHYRAFEKLRDILERAEGSDV